MSGQNQLDVLGLHVKTANDIIDDLTTGMKSIYGSDINIDPSTPDGQLINLFAQTMSDMLELLVSTYNSFNPEAAYGAILDQRCALNGITRQGATYTYVDILVTVTEGLTLTGLDGDPNAAAFTIADDIGNEYYLNASHTFATAGSATLSFRAAEVGEVLVTIGTITNLVTIIAGVASVNNVAGAAIQGIDGESDADLRIRRLNSFMLQGIGAQDSLQAALLATTAVTDALVIENNTGSTVDSVPAHSIWAIVEGGADADIGQVLYEKRAMGCGMYGAETINIDRPNSQVFTAVFDRPTYSALKIKFTLVNKDGSTPDTDYIKVALASALANYYKLGQTAIASELVAMILAIEPLGIVTVCGVSIATSYTETLATISNAHKFTVSSANITII
jgi:uncharacterized phage protein gp47/JayE